MTTPQYKDPFESVPYSPPGYKDPFATDSANQAGSLSTQIVWQSSIPGLKRLNNNTGSQEGTVVGADHATGRAIVAINNKVTVTTSNKSSLEEVGSTVTLLKVGQPIGFQPIVNVSSKKVSGSKQSSSSGSSQVLVNLQGSKAPTLDMCNNDPNNEDTGPGGGPGSDGPGGGPGGGNFWFPPPDDEDGPDEPPNNPPLPPDEPPDEPPNGPNPPNGPGCQPEDECQWYKTPAADSACPPGMIYKGFMEAPVGVFQILCCGEAPPPGEGCDHQYLKWSCSENGCVLAPNGQYDTKEECEEACQVSWDCVQGTCQKRNDNKGQFASYEECSGNGEYIAEYSTDGQSWTMFASSDKPISITQTTQTKQWQCCNAAYWVQISYKVSVLGGPWMYDQQTTRIVGKITGFGVENVGGGNGTGPGVYWLSSASSVGPCNIPNFSAVTACGKEGFCTWEILNTVVTKEGDGPDCTEDQCLIKAFSDGEEVGSVGPFNDGCPQTRVRALGCGQ